VKKRLTASAADGLHRGMDSGTANFRTETTVPTGTTQKPEQSGVAASATPDVIPACNFLTESEQRTLARIRKDRRNGFMVSAVDVAFLLEVIERCSRE